LTHKGGLSDISKKPAQTRSESVRYSEGYT